MGNRSKIITSSLELFNLHGTRAVSTNHIAKAAGISPGNLYYHFKNKGEIICELFVQMSSCCEEAIPRNDPPAIASLEQMDEMLGKIKEIEWKFLFFGREMVNLIEQDDQLRELFLQMQSERLLMIEASIRGMIASGLAVPLGETQIARLTEMIWLISIFWNPYLALRGEPITQERMAESAQMVQMLVTPYLVGASSVVGAPGTSP